MLEPPLDRAHTAHTNRRSEARTTQPVNTGCPPRAHFATTFDPIMKKAEVITLLCGLIGIAMAVGYLKFSSRLAKAEKAAREANELIATMQRSEANKVVAQPEPTSPPPGRPPSVVETPVDPQLQPRIIQMPSPALDDAYVEGVAAYTKKDYEKALQLFQDAADRFPTSEDIFQKIGTCYLDLERYANAVQIYKKGLIHHPESSMMRNNLAVAYRLNGQHEEAITTYKGLLKDSPEDDGAWFFLGCSYMVLRRNSEAEDAFLRSSAITSDWAATWFNLGIVCERQDKASEALMHYSRALTLSPRDKDVWSRFRTLMLDDGPHAPYVSSWLEAPDDADLAAYQDRVEKKVDEVAYSLFPNLRDPRHPMWAALRSSFATVQEKNPNFAKDPTIFLFCSIVAAEKNGIHPKLATPSGSGQLTVQNGTGSDALVKVVSLNGPSLWRRVHVPVGGQRKFDGVPNGHFLVLFALADRIDPDTGALIGNPRASKFEKSLAYSTSFKLKAQSVITTATSYSLTLHPVVGGKAKTEKISIDEFKKY